MMAISCRAFFNTLLLRREFHRFKIECTAIPAFFAGFLIIAITPIPPYIFQPIRVIVIVSLIVIFYYQANISKSLIVSVLFCMIYWVISTFTISILTLFPPSLGRILMGCAEEIVECFHLILMLLFYFKYKNRSLKLTNSGWTRFSLFPLLGLIFIVSIAMTSWDGSSADTRAKIAAILCFVAINGCVFYLILDLINREKEVQLLRLVHERTLSQMNQYRNAQKNYEQQRKFFHDYKNQLDCIQGMLKAGKAPDALAYISSLTGSIRKNTEYINTNHTVVNTVLNQKYQDACEKGITMSMTVNDLSALSMKEEDIVSLLGNLLDNAIEACTQLNQDLLKIIHFRMVLEDEQLILSTRNPVMEPLLIKNNLIQTKIADTVHHGIGLINIDTIIQKYSGASVLKCENGWFCFSAIIPI